MNFENQSWEMSFVDLVFSVLYQWKKILAVACVLALCLGGFQGYRTFMAASDEEFSDEAYIEYQEKLKAFETDKRIKEERLAELELNYENHKTYLDESVLMNMDIHNSYEAVCSLFFTTDYQIMPELSYQNENYLHSILAFYRNALSSNAIYNQISEEVGIPAKYLKELIFVSSDDSNFLTITVLHSDSAVADAILDLMLDDIRELEPQVTEIIGTHSVDEVMRTSGTYVGDQIRNAQAREADRLLDYEEAILSSTNNLLAMKEPQSPQSSVLATFVKWAIMGGIVAVVFYVAIYCVSYPFRNAMYSGNELKKRLGVKVLGSVVDGKKKHDPITAWFRTAEGRINKNSDANYELLAENIRSYSQDAKVLLVTGSAAEEKIAALAEKLQEKLTDVKLVSCGNILWNTEAVRSLNRCDGVILVEKCGKSHYSNIIRELERVVDAGKNVTGCIVLD